MIDVLVVVVKISTYTSILVLAGALMFIRFAWPQGHRSRRMQLLVTRSLVAALLSSGAALLLHGPASTDRGLTAIFDHALLSSVVSTSAGAMMALRLVVLAVVWIVVKSQFARPSPSTAAYLVIAVLLTVLMATMTYTGHAVNRGPFAIALDITHLMAAATWFGGLIVLATVVLPHAKTSELAIAVPAFSTVAFVSVVLLATTGVCHAFIQVGSAQALAESGYGQLICVKLMAFSAVLGIGAFIRRYTQRRFGRGLKSNFDAAGQERMFRRQLWRTVTGEVTIAVVILVVTAVLVGTSPPSHQADALRPAFNTLTH